MIGRQYHKIRNIFFMKFSRTTEEWTDQQRSLTDLNSFAEKTIFLNILKKTSLAKEHMIAKRMFNFFNRVKYMYTLRKNNEQVMSYSIDTILMIPLIRLRRLDRAYL